MSVRIRTRADGSQYTQVRFRDRGKETSVSFDDHQEAEKFDELVRRMGADKALEICRIVGSTDRSITLSDWLERHNDHLTGVDAATLARYRSIAVNDIAPTIGALPLKSVSPDDVAKWVNGMRKADGSMPSGKTIANKHGYLAGALNSAVERGLIASNPCDHTRLPRWHREEMVFLEPDEYQILRSAVSEYWQPLIDFLVTSGARWSEAVALVPSDIDVRAGTVRISRAWKAPSNGSGYRLGPTKTKMSTRTINVPSDVLGQLDLSGEWVFTNSGRGRRNEDGVVRIHSFTPNVWHPAVARAMEAGLVKRPRIHDLRHTCASWLIQAGRPLPAIQQHLGHESITTTVGTYGHLDRASGKDNANVLGSLLKH